MRLDWTFSLSRFRGVGVIFISVTVVLVNVASILMLEVGVN